MEVCVAALGRSVEYRAGNGKGGGGVGCKLKDRLVDLFKKEKEESWNYQHWNWNQICTATSTYQIDQKITILTSKNHKNAGKEKVFFLQKILILLF